ncbi:MAG TPA: PIG-L family deacetylase [Gemmatimonadaceae bacterium]|nr:PIG-L family deacetylase [Gemmatimonadaceae bacterium]
MTSSPLRVAACAIMLSTSLAIEARAQGSTPPSPGAVGWRDDAAAVGTTMRVLFIGAHPDDEDNALIAWLSLGRHVETAYLSLTRGENGVNVSGRERETMLGMVRTAELLAERKRDRAHQYFTRAYDFGFAKNDSIVNDAWPRDSLLRDIVSVMRAFRPHVVISLFTGDTTNHDGQHQVAGQLAREAFVLAGDSARHSAKLSSRFGAWTIGAFYQRVDTAGPTDIRINVGELNHESGRTYAELGSDIRRLQRTQVIPSVPPVGIEYRYLHREALRASGDQSNGGAQSPAVSIFATSDTGWTRFATLSLADSVRSALTALVSATASPSPTTARPNTDTLGTRDATIGRLANVVRLASHAHDALACGEPAEVGCSGALGDLAVSLATTRDRASRALLGASGVVIDATAEREAVAVGDTIRVVTQVYNGGKVPVAVSSVVVGDALFPENAATVMPDSVQRWNGYLLMRGVTTPWWTPGGLQRGTWLYATGSGPGVAPNVRLVTGDDRLFDTRAIVNLRVSDADISAGVAPIVSRGTTGLRGDERRPVVGVPRYSVLLEQGNQYARAGAPFERLMRVWVGSALDHKDTVQVTLKLPPGLTTDSATRSIVLPAAGGRTLFFRVRGRWQIGRFAIDAAVTPRPEHPRPEQQNGRRLVGIATRDITHGFVAFEYPHIATQRYPRPATDSIEAVDVRVPAKLRVAFIRGNRDEQIDSRIGELGVEIYPIDPAVLGFADLSIYSTLLIAPHAFSEVEALLINVAAVRQFAARGGTVVVMSAGDELLEPGVLPYPVTLGGRKPVTALDGKAPIRFSTPRSRLLDWPNRITSADFDYWTGARARELPVTFDAHYRTAIEMNDDDKHVTAAGILATPVGKGVFIYTSLAFDRQLVATNPGAARLLVNLLAAGLATRPE